MKYMFAYYTRGQGTVGPNQSRKNSFRVGRKSETIIEPIDAQDAKEAVGIIEKRLGEIRQTTGRHVKLEWAVAVAHNLDISKLKMWV